jgi:hypothetical protein
MEKFRRKIGEVATYLQGMERRAQRRKSPWNLLLALLAIVLVPLIWFVLIRAVLTLGHIFSERSADLQSRSELASFMIVIPLFFVTIPLAGLSVNWLVKFIPRAVEVFDQEAEGDDLAKVEGRIGPKYDEAQAGLILGAILAGPLALVSLFAGLFMS